MSFYDKNFIIIFLIFSYFCPLIDFFSMNFIYHWDLDQDSSLSFISTYRKTCPLRAWYHKIFDYKAPAPIKITLIEHIKTIYIYHKKKLKKHILCFGYEMYPKVIESLKNRKKLHILDLKQLKGCYKIKFFEIIFVMPWH